MVGPSWGVSLMTDQRDSAVRKPPQRGAGSRNVEAQKTLSTIGRWDHTAVVATIRTSEYARVAVGNEEEKGPFDQRMIAFLQVDLVPILRRIY